jgi:prepilin-type N-terminal cleavage/methylation domain-containing protein/prepilin-type processing-associated H-X9-DG protein
MSLPPQNNAPAARRNRRSATVRQEDAADSKRAFTLLELLVVIAIVAILAALLMPAVRSAMNSSKSLKCTAQLRQIGIVFNLFQNDHGYYVPASWEASNMDVPTVSQNWYQTHTPLDVYSSGKMGEISVCPCNLALNAPVGSGVVGYPYFCNYNLMVGTALPVVRTKTMTRNPRTLVLLLDNGASSSPHWYGGGNDQTDFIPHGASPHSGNTSILWLDGHVSQQLPTSLVTNNFRFASPYNVDPP